MKWTAVIVSALLLGGCATRSMPSLEDVPPTAQASTAPGTVTGSSPAKPNLEDLPPTAQASTAPGTVAGSGRKKPNLEDLPPTAQASTSTGTVASSGRAVEQTTGQPPVEPPAEDQSAWAPSPPVETANPGHTIKLTAQQRSDIEQGVRRGLSGPNPTEFGPMAATISKVTSKSYIVCGWVKGGDSAAGYRPFLAMYVPYMRTALLVAVAGKQPEELIRGRCIGEGVPLPS